MQATLWEEAEVVSMPGACCGLQTPDTSHNPEPHLPEVHTVATAAKHNTHTHTHTKGNPMTWRVQARMCLFDASRGIGAAGEWVCDASVEGAWASGRALATRLVSHLACNPGQASAFVARFQCGP